MSNHHVGVELRIMTTIAYLLASAALLYTNFWASDWQCERWQDSCDRRNLIRAALVTSFHFNPVIKPQVIVEILEGNQVQRRWSEPKSIISFYQGHNLLLEHLMLRALLCFLAAGLMAGTLKNMLQSMQQSNNPLISQR